MTVSFVRTWVTDGPIVVGDSVTQVCVCVACFLNLANSTAVKNRTGFAAFFNSLTAVDVCTVATPGIDRCSNRGGRSCSGGSSCSGDFQDTPCMVYSGLIDVLHIHNEFSDL